MKDLKFCVDYKFFRNLHIGNRISYHNFLLFKKELYSLYDKYTIVRISHTREMENKWSTLGKICNKFSLPPNKLMSSRYVEQIVAHKLPILPLLYTCWIAFQFFYVHFTYSHGFLNTLTSIAWLSMLYVYCLVSLLGYIVWQFKDYIARKRTVL